MGRNKTIEDDELLEVARRVFRERGHTATTRDVAQAAGISQSVLYQRFKTKEDLFFAAMIPPKPDADALLGTEEDAATLGGERYLAVLAERILVYFDHVTPAVLHVITHPAFGPETFQQAHERVLGMELVGAIAARLDTLQQRGIVSGAVDTRAAAYALVSVVHTIAMFAVLSGAGHGQGAVHGYGGSDAEASSHRTAAVSSMVGVLWSGLSPSTREPGGTEEG